MPENEPVFVEAVTNDALWLMVLDTLFRRRAEGFVVSAWNHTKPGHTRPEFGTAEVTPGQRITFELELINDDEGENHGL